MQFFARHTQCGHIIWAGPLADTAAVLSLTDELHGTTCPTCGELVEHVDYAALPQDATQGFDKAPEPRRTENKLKSMSRRDVERSSKHLDELGADTRGLAAELKNSALGLTPPQWRDALSKIPVGVLPTYEPNAECIRFKDSSVPALEAHRRSLRIQAVGTALEFLGAGRPQGKDLVDVPAIAKFEEMLLTRTMTSFLLCHEYGHAVLNHADEIRSIGGTASPDFYLLERSRAMELEADAWGQDAIIGAFTQGRNLEKTLDALDDKMPSYVATPFKQDISLASPCIALLYFEFLDAVEELLVRHGVVFTAQSAPLGELRRRARQYGRDAEEQGTHPSNRERFQALYAHLHRNANFTAHSFVGAFEGLLDGIKTDLEELIDKSKLIPGAKFSDGPKKRPVGNRNAKSWRMESNLAVDVDTRRSLESVWNELVEKAGTGVPLLDEAEVERHTKRLADEAVEYYEAQKYADAEGAFRKVLNWGETTESIGLYPMLGVCHEQRDDIPGAMAAYRRCIEVAPDSDAAACCAFFLGKIMLFDEKDPDAAETTLMIAARSTVPDISARATFWLGTIAHNRGEVDAALAKYTDIYEHRAELGSLLPETAAMAAFNIGVIYQDRMQYSAAFTKFTYARDNGDPETRATAAERLRRLPRR